MRTDSEIQSLLEKEEAREKTLNSYFKRKEEVALFTKKNMKAISAMDNANGIPIDMISSDSDEENPSRQSKYKKQKTTTMTNKRQPFDPKQHITFDDDGKPMHYRRANVSGNAKVLPLVLGLEITQKKKLRLMSPTSPSNSPRNGRRVEIEEGKQSKQKVVGLLSTYGDTLKSKIEEDEINAERERKAELMKRIRKKRP